MSPTAAKPRRSQGTSLQQAASMIFALTALLPILIFVWILYTLDAIYDSRAQLGIGLSLLVSILGFTVLRVTMRRTSEVLQLLVRAEARARSAAAPAAAVAPTDGPAEPSHTAERPPTSRAARSASQAESAPAIGAISELRDAAEMVIRRLRQETEPLLGRAVRVAVVNFDEPEIGILARVSEIGLVLEREGAEFGVMWRLITSVELDPSVAAEVEAAR